MVETTILYMSTRKNLAQVLNEVGAMYKVDPQAIAARVKQEFAAKRSTDAEDACCQSPTQTRE